MQITDIKLLMNDLIDTNSSDFSDAKKVRLLNKAQSKIVNLIMENDYLQQYDDENYTDLNEGYLDLTSGQNDYNIREDENFADLLYISKVFILDPDDNWIELEKKEIELSSESDTPTSFRLTGKTIILQKTPNYSKSNGIKIYFGRKPQDISVNDTTKEPGIPNTFHFLLALYADYDFARSKNMDNRNDLLIEIREEEIRLGLFIKNKNKKVVNRMVANVENNH